MQISDLNTITNAPFDYGTETEASNEMGKETFMKLLVEELKHQDPLNPTDSKDFTAQLAQFSSLEKLENIDASIQTLALYQASATNASAVNLIGKQVEANGKSIVVKNGNATGLSFDIEDTVYNIKVNIYDKDGNLVASEDVGNKNAGSHDFVWDGKHNSGTVAPDGIYTFSLTGEDASGKSAAMNTKIIGTVDGLSFADGNAMLSLDGRMINLADIIAVRSNPAASSTTTTTTTEEEVVKKKEQISNREYAKQKSMYLDSLGLPMLNNEKKLINTKF